MLDYPSPVLRNVHPARRGYDQNVIIRFPSLRFESPSRQRLFSSSPAVLFAVPNVYDTVVLATFRRKNSVLDPAHRRIRIAGSTDPPFFGLFQPFAV